VRGAGVTATLRRSADCGTDCCCGSAVVDDAVAVTAADMPADRDVRRVDDRAAAQYAPHELG